MKLTERQLRNIVREVIAEAMSTSSVKHDDDKLLVQDMTDEGMGVGPGGYDLAFNTIPEADFEDIRRARFKASGMTDKEAGAAAKKPLRHRGQKPGRG